MTLPVPHTTHTRRRALALRAPRQAQRGISLFVVLVILLLTLIIVLGSLRVANLNETIVGNQSDIQRSTAAAEALLAAAQRDIRENGPECVHGDFAQCRFPRLVGSMDDFNTLRNAVGIDECGNGTPGRPLGVCISARPGAEEGPGGTLSSAVTTANYPMHAGNIGVNGRPQRIDNGARYTNFARPPGGATAGNFASGNVGAGAAADQRSLAIDDSTSRYWVEVFPYDVHTGALSDSSNLPVPDGVYPFIFRISVLATGLKPGTQTVLRKYYVPYPRQPV